MCSHDRGNDRKTEAGATALPGSRRVGTNETLEEGGGLNCSNPGTVVGHFDEGR
jgi:hypothetical protein